MKTRILLVFSLLLSLAADASTVTFTFTNSVGVADTHPIKIYPISPPTVGNSYSFVSRTAITLYPDSSGMSQTNLMQGCYTVQNNFIGDGITFCVPNDTNTYPVGLLATDGFTVPTYSKVIKTITSADGTVTIVPGDQSADLSVPASRGLLFYDPVSQTMAEASATNLFSFWSGKNTNSNWKFYNADGYTPSTNCWTYPLDFSGLASGSLNALYQTNGVDDIALIAPAYGITASHAWGGYVGMPVIFNNTNGTLFTNFVAGASTPVSGVDIMLIAFSNAAPAGVNPFWLLPTNALTYMPTNLLGDSIVWMRNNNGSAGGRHMNLQLTDSGAANGVLSAQSAADPAIPFFDGASTSGDSGSPVFMVLQTPAGLKPIFLYSVQYPWTAGPWISYPGYLPNVQSLIGTNQLLFADLSRYQGTLPNPPPNGSTNLHGWQLPVAGPLLSDDAVMVERSPSLIPSTALSTLSNLLYSLTQLPGWPTNTSSSSGTNGIDIRPLTNSFTGPNTFTAGLTSSGPATVSGTLTVSSNGTYGGSFQQFLSPMFTHDMTVSGDLMVGNSPLTGGGRAIWMAVPGAGGTTNAILYTQGTAGSALYIYAGTNLSKWLSGGFSRPVAVQDGFLFADLTTSSNFPPAKLLSGGAATGQSLTWDGSAWSPIAIGGNATNNDLVISNYALAIVKSSTNTTTLGNQGLALKTDIITTNATLYVTSNGFFNLYLTNGALLAAVSNGVVYLNTNVVINGSLTVNSPTNTAWVSNLVATGSLYVSNTASFGAGVTVAGTLQLAGLPLANTIIGVDAGKNLINYSAGNGQIISGGSVRPTTNSIAFDGIVTAGTNHASLFWGTDASGNPDWRSPGSVSLPSGTNGGDMLAYHGGNWIVSPMGQYIFGGTTSTNGILTNLTTFGTGRSSLQLTNGYTVRITGDFTGAGSTNSGAWTKTALFRNNAGTVSLIQSNQLAGPTTGNAANWNCQYAISGTNIQFQAVGDTNEFVTWQWQGFWEMVTNATQTAAAPASLPAGAKIVLLASTVSGGDGTLSSASVPWLDQSGNHYDAYAVNPGGVYITNSSTHKEWHSKTAASGWFITNSAMNALNNITGATMICTFTAESTNAVGQLAFINVSALGSFGTTWLGQRYPATPGQDSLDWSMRRIGTDTGAGLFGPGVSRGVRYTGASIVNWNAQTAATYTNGVLLSSVTGITGFASGNTDSNASQGMTVMCSITSSGPTYGNSMTGSLANFVLYPFILTTNQIQQAATYLNSLP